MECQNVGTRKGSSFMVKWRAVSQCLASLVLLGFPSEAIAQTKLTTAPASYLTRPARPIILAGSPQFSDTSGYWASACIEGMALKQLLRGDGDGRFRPQGTMTRAEFAAVMIQTFPNATPVRQAPNFSDVAPDYWARAAIAQAYEKGFLAGYPGNIFRPTQPITRAQAITILANTQGLAGSQVNSSILNYFEDRAGIPGYAERAIAAATLSNFVVNYPVVTQLRPQANLSRGEAAAFLCQVQRQADPTSLQPRYAVPAQYIAQADDYVEAPLPPGLPAQLMDAMRQQLGGAVEDFAIASAAPVRWRSCAQWPCQPQDYDGFRVKVSGKGETWTYYSASTEPASDSPAYLIQLDGTASLNPAVQASLKSLNNRGPADDLKILAATPIPSPQTCPNPATCDVPPHWEILTNVAQQPFHRIDLQGNNLEQTDFSTVIPTEQAGLPEPYIAAMLQDLQRRQHQSPSLPMETSIKAIRWNDCDGSSLKPSEPARGICPDAERSGWQLSTRSGSLTWIYYFLAPPSTLQLDFVRPDGLQSLPQSVRDAVIAAANRYDRLNGLSDDPTKPNQYRLEWASAQFFDRCLQSDPNAAGRPLICSQAIESGWRVEVIGNQLTSSGGQTLLTYHSNLDGSNVRFVAKGTWFPPP